MYYFRIVLIIEAGMKNIIIYTFQKPQEAKALPTTLINQMSKCTKNVMTKYSIN